ncbi:hypothetical protein [Solimonas variicoloris]|uniref:hypothetical protein n=1 Tax=Solimonas variicoloris TaxID=254408 RepID=UPI000377A28D|nr:hypothetical protein [Solimonas variicoloris]
MSRALLLIEALLCAYVTFLGVMIALGAIIPPFLGASFQASDIALGIMVLVLLTVAWRLFFVFMRGGQRSARSINKAWWVVASMGAFACSVSAAIVQFGEESSVNGQSFSLLAPGVFFVVPFLHLAAEVWLREQR